MAKFHAILGQVLKLLATFSGATVLMTALLLVGDYTVGRTLDPVEAYWVRGAIGGLVAVVMQLRQIGWWYPFRQREREEARRRQRLHELHAEREAIVRDARAKFDSKGSC